MSVFLIRLQTISLRLYVSSLSALAAFLALHPQNVLRLHCIQALLLAAVAKLSYVVL
jgi:hypothetical protein